MQECRNGRLRKLTCSRKGPRWECRILVLSLAVMEGGAWAVCQELFGLCPRSEESAWAGFRRALSLPLGERRRTPFHVLRCASVRCADRAPGRYRAGGGPLHLAVRTPPAAFVDSVGRFKRTVPPLTGFSLPGVPPPRGAATASSDAGSSEWWPGPGLSSARRSPARLS